MGWRAGRNELVVERLLGRQQSLAGSPDASRRYPAPAPVVVRGGSARAAAGLERIAPVRHRRCARRPATGGAVLPRRPGHALPAPPEANDPADAALPRPGGAQPARRAHAGRRADAGGGERRGAAARHLHPGTQPRASRHPPAGGVAGSRRTLRGGGTAHPRPGRFGQPPLWRQYQRPAGQHRQAHPRAREAQPAVARDDRRDTDQRLCPWAATSWRATRAIC